MRIRWTDRAANDLTEICDYLEIEASKETARSVATSVCHKIELLMSHPHIGRPGRIAGTQN